MRCFTTWPMANLAVRIASWASAGEAVRLAISMTKVLLRMGFQATRLTWDELTPTLQIRCIEAHGSLYARSWPKRVTLPSVDVSHRPVDSGQRVLGSSFG